MVALRLFDIAEGMSSANQFDSRTGYVVFGSSGPLW